jgi:hypothetical protein
MEASAFSVKVSLGLSDFAYINVKLLNLDLKQGISYLEREGEGGRQRKRQIDRDRESKT